MFKKGYTPWNKGKKGYTNAGSFTKENAKRGKNNLNWKGDKVGYFSLHAWLARTFGKADKCEACGISEIPPNRKRYFHWALLKGKNYERKRENFWMLCQSCHIKYDMTQEWKDNISKSKIGHIPWNKGFKRNQWT